MPRVKMPAAFREPLPGAATARVNVKGEKAFFRPGQSPDTGLHQNAVHPLVKPHHPLNLRVVPSPAQMRNGVRPSCLLHTITPASLCIWGGLWYCSLWRGKRTGSRLAPRSLLFPENIIQIIGIVPGLFLVFILYVLKLCEGQPAVTANIQIRPSHGKEALQVGIVFIIRILFA